MGNRSLGSPRVLRSPLTHVYVLFMVIVNMMLDILTSLNLITHATFIKSSQNGTSFSERYVRIAQYCTA